MTIEAMKHALECIRCSTEYKIGNPAFEQSEDALRQAIEQAEKQEQTFGETNVELGFYSDNASNGQQRKLVGKVEMGQLVGNRPHKSASDPDAQGEVAVIKGFDEYGPMLGWFKHWANFPVGTKLYTTPQPQREWVGLTDKEIRYLQDVYDVADADYARAIEAKLKEKNT